MLLANLSIGYFRRGEVHILNGSPLFFLGIIFGTYPVIFYLRILHLLRITLSLGCKVFIFSESQDAVILSFGIMGFIVEL